MKTAVVHDFFDRYAGAERVLEQMLAVLPEADLYGLFDITTPEHRRYLGGRPVRTTFLQHMPGIARHHRLYLPLMPLAIEQLDLSAYDLVVSSSYAVAKGVLTGPDQLHLCLCYSPMRYAWDLQHQYLRESGLARGPRSLAARWLLHRLRIWDARTANGVDGFIAISRFVARRIRKAYRRDATVIYPPVDVEAFPLREAKEDFYLTASRLVPYKRVDLIATAFAAMPGRRLVVIGEGPEMAKVRAAAGPNVTVLGHQPHDVLRDHMQRARAFVFAAEEDFGIVPLEAQACGTPVIAYGRGGAAETIRDAEPHPTGVLFAEQTAGAIRDAVVRFEQQRELFAPRACREHVLGLSPERFRQEFRRYVDDQLALGERPRAAASAAVAV